MRQPISSRFSVLARPCWAVAAVLAAGCAGAAMDGAGGPGVGGGSGSGGAGGESVSACLGAAPDVAAAPWRRITRAQYANAVRDLLSLPQVGVDGLGPDEAAGPFASNLVASVTGLGTEQYMESAEALARAAAGRLAGLVPCDPARGDAACAASFIKSFGRRVYRRPLSTDEDARYRALFAAASAAAGFADGVRQVIQTMLQSPYFLYQVELGATPGAAPGTVVALDGYETATRLAFFLWSSVPDDALLDAAAAGALADRQGLDAQVSRMLADDRARATLTSFHAQWLGLQDLAAVTKDVRTYRAWSPDLPAAMLEETAAFVDHVIRRGDGKLATLLSAPLSFASDKLLAVYGAARPSGAAPGDPVALDPAQRAGLLTQAGFLARHAHEAQSSPVARGAIVRRNVLCDDLPDPPPNVNNAPPAPAPGATTRERFAAHQTEPSCAACHKLIDGIGLGFENYDGMGAFRAQESGRAIDAAGEIVEGGDVTGRFAGAVELSHRLAESATVRACASRQWLRFALGRLEQAADACAVAALAAAFDDDGGDVRALLAAIVRSEAFRSLKVKP